MTKASRSIAARVADTLARREAAASRAGRHPLEIRLVAATKAVPVDRLITGVRAGLRVFGENYVQEGLEKIERVRKELGAAADDLSWHIIGGLQRNKVRAAIPAFDLIHSVDSLPLAKEINRRAGAHGISRQILLEVNLGGESTKRGFTPEGAIEAALAINKLESIRLSGLMTIPPVAEDPEDSRPHFRALRELLEKIRRRGLANENFRELSMGMSADFEVAIEEGATWIRLGRAIFGPRQPR